MNEVVIGGWDISDMNLGDAMRRAEVSAFPIQHCWRVSARAGAVVWLQTKETDRKTVE